MGLFLRFFKFIIPACLAFFLLTARPMRSSRLSSFTFASLNGSRRLSSEFPNRQTWKKGKVYKTDVINDNPGHTHCHTSSDHYFHFKIIVLFCGILKSGDGRMTCVKTMITPTIFVGRPSGSILRPRKAINNFVKYTNLQVTICC